MHCPQVFLSCAIGATPCSESSKNCVANLLVTPSWGGPFSSVDAWVDGRLLVPSMGSSPFVSLAPPSVGTALHHDPLVQIGGDVHLR